MQVRGFVLFSHGSGNQSRHPGDFLASLTGRRPGKRSFDRDICAAIKRSELSTPRAHPAASNLRLFNSTHSSDWSSTAPLTVPNPAFKRRGEPTCRGSFLDKSSRRRSASAGEHPTSSANQEHVTPSGSADGGFSLVWTSLRVDGSWLCETSSPSLTSVEFAVRKSDSM
jgi:hypothetical protein